MIFSYIFFLFSLRSSFNWTYCSLVYSATEYGMKGYETLTKYAADYGVCFGLQIRIDDTSTAQFNTTDYDRVVDQLRPLARIVVVFTDKTTAAQLMAAVKRKKHSGLIWVGCDGWSSREAVSQGIKINKIKNKK